MGCDIHFRVEYLGLVETLALDPDGEVVVHPLHRQWQPAERLTPNKYWDESDPPEQKMHVDYNDQFYTGRNYALFAKLADVRNYDDATTPIADPRGLPPDVSDEVGYELSEDDADLHSHSWFTLYELMAADIDDIEGKGSYGRWGGSRFDQTLELMKVVADTKCEGNLHRVRAVFAFDN